MLDLVVALAPHADEAAISKLYSTIRPYLEVSQMAGLPQDHPWGKRGLLGKLVPVFLSGQPFGRAQKARAGPPNFWRVVLAGVTELLCDAKELGKEGESGVLQPETGAGTQASVRARHCRVPLLDEHHCEACEWSGVEVGGPSPPAASPPAWHRVSLPRSASPSEAGRGPKSPQCWSQLMVAVL